MKLDRPTLIQQHRLTPRGIIHIGAYEGKDLKRYPTPDTAKIFLIEANPKAVEQLQANFANKPNIIISQTAIALRVSELQSPHAQHRLLQSLAIFDD